MKKFSLYLSIFLLFFMYFTTSAAASGNEPRYIPGPTYPGTNTEMKPGDILLSPKSLSTKIVGHVAIVGNDYRLYHSYPDSDGRRIDDISTYVGLFAKGDKFKVLKVYNGGGAAAASWAQSNIGKITSYNAFFGKMSVINENYCSKFVWQSYYYGAGKDISGLVGGLTGSTNALLLPSTLDNGIKTFVSTSFTK